MGDAESREAFRATLVGYLERYADELGTDGRDRLRDNPLRLFDSKEARVREIMRDAPKLVDALTPAARAHLDRVLAALDALGVAYDLDPMLVRGFDYYTHTVFEFSSDRIGAQSAIGGGGRYDHLVEWLGGPPTPGVGFGTGIERIVLALSTTEAPEPGFALDCYLAATPDVRVALLPLLAELRARGLRCECAFGDRSMRSMLRQADALGARRAVIVGARDMEAGVATLRDMRSGDQEQVPLAQVADVLAGDAA
jgi:histidyl-tRNA synthetase